MILIIENKAKSQSFYDSLFFFKDKILLSSKTKKVGALQTNKNASPIFLLAAPRYKSTSLWTTSAIEFTNYITSPCRI